MSEAKLFVRKASGLVRAWSVFDAFIYATFSINLITLGLFIFSYCWYFEGSLGTTHKAKSHPSVGNTELYIGEHLICNGIRSDHHLFWNPHIVEKYLPLIQSPLTQLV